MAQRRNTQTRNRTKTTRIKNMLIDIPYKVGDTVSLKLISGEEIVARLENEQSANYTLKKPMVLIAQEKGLGLAPFMF